MVVMSNKIIDIHTHMLYKMDDGASSREMTLQLLGVAYSQGVRGIFFTNHSGGILKHGINSYEHRFEKIKNLAHDMYQDLRLYKGCEILCSKEMMIDIIKNIKAGVFPTLNHTEFVLIEVDPKECKFTAGTLSQTALV